MRDDGTGYYNLINFKNECKQKQNQNQERIDKYNNQKEDQKQYGVWYEPKISKWEGTLGKAQKCPLDSEKLKEEVLFVKDQWKFVILSCRCGYKFARALLI